MGHEQNKPLTSSISWTEATVRGRRLVFYFTKAEHALSNLRDNRIKISKFSACNDLFELASFSYRSANVRAKHKRWLETVESKFGLICFSSDWRHPLMWAHYRDLGKGVCLACSIVDEAIDELTYVPSRLAREKDFEFPNPNGSKEFREFCSTKFSAWRYEKEHRLLCDLSQESQVESEGELDFRKCGSDIKIVGIINGPKPVIGRSDLLRAAADSVDYFQCRPAFKSFRMVSQRKKDLWP